MRIRFYNARILTMRENEDIFTGELHTEGNRITYVGHSEDAPEGDFFREIDCKGNVLMPGFKNCHTHSGMTAFRSLADDLNLQDWLNNEIFPREAKMSGEDCYILTKLAILEYLTSGVTSIQDMYLTPETIADACAEMGMRCELVSGLNKFGPTLDVLERRYNELNGRNPLIGFKMGVHAEYTCDKELLQNVSKLIHKYEAPLYVHMSETKTEVDECIGRYGMTPVAFFDSLGLFDFGGVIYHGVWTTDEDMEIMLKRNIGVVTNPASNLKLASGIAPIDKYLKKGITVGIGTDGPSSNNALDMFREMYLCSVLQKLRCSDAAAMPAENVLRAATVGGAAAMGINSGSIEVGKNADFAVIDMSAPNMQPENDIVKNLVYSGSGANVKMTAVNGNILYENGEFFIGEDMDVLYGRVRKICERIFP